MAVFWETPVRISEILFIGIPVGLITYVERWRTDFSYPSHLTPLPRPRDHNGHAPKPTFIHNALELVLKKYGAYDCISMDWGLFVDFSENLINIRSLLSW